MSGCEHKKVYTTWRHAENDRQAIRRKISGHEVLEVYWCPQHNGWHVGHANGHKKGKRHGRRRRIL